MDFTLFDYLYIGVAVASTVWAFGRGGVYELVATISWLVAAIVSRFVSPELNGIFQAIFSLPEPTIGTLVAAYFVVFFGVLVVFGLFNQRLRDWVQDSILQITDRTLGVIFGILRAIIVMGILYWVMLWYYDGAAKPTFLTSAKTRSVMQMTAVKLNEWFVPGKNRLLEEDVAGAKKAEDLYNSLIEPAIKAAAAVPDLQGAGAPGSAAADPENDGTGYKESERNALENQLLQLDNTPEFSDEEEKSL
ncbi:MAG: CvpA family protein [Rickettsiales bacterium]|jgi:membrane protein required for colicin V production|nr:CvpA family protein [Rickettsiales bacterium]